MKIIEALLDTLTTDAVVRDMRSNPSWIAVWSRYCGLASTLAAAEHGQDGIAVSDPERFIGRSARELAALGRVRSGSWRRASAWRRSTRSWR